MAFRDISDDNDELRAVRRGVAPKLPVKLPVKLSSGRARTLSNPS